MPRPKLLFVTHEASRTGSPINLLRFLRWLRRSTDQDFEVVAAKAGPLTPEFAQVARLHGAESLAGKSEAQLRRFLGGFGLIYANSCCSGGLVESWPLGAVPVVTHLLEVMDSSIDAVGPRTLAAMIRFSNRFIVSTKHGARDLERRFGVPADRMSVHYCMVDEAAVSAGLSASVQDDLRRVLDVPKDAFVVAGCGTVEPRKGTDLFVQMAARFCRKFGRERPVRFLWIGGDRDADFARYLRRDVKRLGLEAQIAFTGETAAPHNCLALASVLCVTARVEALAMAMMEAALLGVPAVYFEGAGGAGEFCDFGGGHGVPYLDLDAMAASCREHMLDPALGREVGRRGAETVRTRFTVDAVAPALWAEIEGWLREPPPMSRFRADGCSVGDVFESWRLDESYEAGYVRATAARTAAKRRARALAAEGRPTEAVAVLIQAARMNGRRDPAEVQERLIDLGDELAPLDAEKSRYLLREAERLAAFTGRPVSEVRPGLPDNSRRRDGRPDRAGCSPDVPALAAP